MSRWYFHAPLAFATFTLSAGCGLFEKSVGSAPPYAAGSHNGAIVDTAADSGPNDTSGYTDTANTSTITWAGNWQIAVSYDSTCTINGLPSSDSRDDDFAMSITGDNNNLSVMVDASYPMIGLGDDEFLYLEGTFPLVASNSYVAQGEEGSVSFAESSIASEDEVSGSFNGSIEASNLSCVILGGTFTMSR